MCTHTHTVTKHYTQNSCAEDYFRERLAHTHGDLFVCSAVALARTINMQCSYDISGREIIKYTVKYGTYIQSWPALLSCDGKLTEGACPGCTKQMLSTHSLTLNWMPRCDGEPMEGLLFLAWARTLDGICEEGSKRHMPILAATFFKKSVSEVSFWVAIAGKPAIFIQWGIWATCGSSLNWEEVAGWSA